MTAIACAVSGKRWPWGYLVRAALALPALTGCGLDVEHPDIATPGDLTGPLVLNALYAGAIGDFEAGYAGGSGDGSFAGGVVSVSATLADEVSNTDAFAERQELDQRLIRLDNREVTRLSRRLHRARAALEGTSARLEQASALAGAPDARVGELLALAGFTYIGFAENFCSGVPVSTVTEDGVLHFGSPETIGQLLDTAIVRFDAAMTKANGDATVQALAQVGKARAQLDRGDFAGAGATAAAVDPAFLYQLLASVTASTGASGSQVGLENGFYAANVIRGGISVADREGANGLAFRSAADPRVPVVEDPAGGVDGTQLFVLKAYAITGEPLGREAPLPLASGLEARLIEAEAQMQAGNFATPGTGTLAILNELRANFVGGPLAPLVDPVTPTAREDILFEERAFWLYATGHRLGDLRRLVRQYGRNAETVFPTGLYRGGPSILGPDVNLPVTEEELNNPNFTGCLDRNA